MANERVNTYRNTGTVDAPKWEKYFIKTLAECIFMDETEGKTIKDYVDETFEKLVNGAPETLDTLKELADAITENEDIVDALNAAITNKANQSDLEALIGRVTTAEGKVETLESKVEELEGKVEDSASHNHTIENIEGLQDELDKANEHIESAHAPSDAEKNVIDGVQVNGVDLSVDSDRKVNIEVPTISVGATAPTTAAPNSLWFEVEE